MPTDPSTFDEVKHGELDKSPASPDVDIESFHGICIAAPEKVALRANRLPVCGAWVFGESTVLSLGDMEDKLVYLVRNTSTHAADSGNFHENIAVFDPQQRFTLDDDENLVEIEDDDQAQQAGDDEDDEETRMRGWFNYDLARFWKMSPGRYRLVVVLNEFQSNAVEFEVSP